MERQELIGKINSALADEFEVEESVITPDAPIKETLELDSLSLVDLVALIESISVSRLKALRCQASRHLRHSTISFTKD